MIVDVASLPYEGKRYAGEEPADVLGLGGESDISVERPATYDLTVYMASGELIVEGNLAATVCFRCSRCAEVFPFQVEIAGFRCVREVSGEAESVDLTDEIRESIILAFPNYPVCSPGCKGLCPACGNNLNQNDCGCKPPADARWGALDGLTGGGK